jgi:hypothetical protein
MTKTAFNKKNIVFTSKLDLNLRKKLAKCYISCTDLYGAETWTLYKVDPKYLESFGMWCWRRMEKISWTDSVRNEEVLRREGEEYTVYNRKEKANWMGYMLCRNCLLKHIIEGKMEGGTEATGRQGRRRKQVLDELGETRGYWKLKEEALDRTPWRTRCGKGYGRIVRPWNGWICVILLTAKSRASPLAPAAPPAALGMTGPTPGTPGPPATELRKTGRV